MNSKMIAIIAVIAMCGAALVGVGYAYTATYESGENSGTASMSYVTIDPGVTAITSSNLDISVDYDTLNKAGTKYIKPTGSNPFISTGQTVIVTTAVVGDGSYSTVKCKLSGIEGLVTTSDYKVKILYKVNNDNDWSEITSANGAIKEINLVNQAENTITFALGFEMLGTASAAEDNTAGYYQVSNYPTGTYNVSFTATYSAQ